MCTNSTFCPHSIFMCFPWISEQTAIISLYSINWLVFITETECVYCAVRTESLCIVQDNINLYRVTHVRAFLYVLLLIYFNIGNSCIVHLLSTSCPLCFEVVAVLSSSWSFPSVFYKGTCNFHKIVTCATEQTHFASCCEFVYYVSYQNINSNSNNAFRGKMLYLNLCLALQHSISRRSGKSLKPQRKFMLQWHLNYSLLSTLILAAEVAALCCEYVRESF
jgi:hypothetical protein